MQQYLKRKTIKNSVRDCISAMPDNPACYQLVFGDDYFWSWNDPTVKFYEFNSRKNGYFVIFCLKVHNHEYLSIIGPILRTNLYWLRAYLKTSLSSWLHWRSFHHFFNARRTVTCKGLEWESKTTLARWGQWDRSMNGWNCPNYMKLKID